MGMVRFSGARETWTDGKQEFVERGPIMINPALVAGAYDNTILIAGNQIRVMEKYDEIKEKLEGGQKMKIKVDEGAFCPERAHDTDAGLDLKARKAVRVPAKGSAIIGTGVHVELPKGCCGLLVSKSGLNVKHNLTSTGLIDEPYRGEIMVKLYNHGNESYQVNAGDKISQLVVIPVLYEPVELVEELNENTERGTAGFGSTGR